MYAEQQLIGYDETLEITGMSKRTLLNRIASEGITVYVDGRDRRRRLLDRADVDRMIKVEPVERGEKAA